MGKSIFLQQALRGLGLALHRGWAKVMLYRYRDFVQHHNQPCPMAAEAADEDDDEANASYHHPPLAMGGRPLECAPCLGVFLLVARTIPAYRGGAKNNKPD